MFAGEHNCKQAASTYRQTDRQTDRDTLTNTHTLFYIQQEMRTWKEAEDAGQKVGFKLVWSIDLATSSIVSGPW